MDPDRAPGTANSSGSGDMDVVHDLVHDPVSRLQSPFPAPRGDCIYICKAVVEYAKYLGMDENEDQAFFWIAEAVLTSELPRTSERVESLGSSCPDDFECSGLARNPGRGWYFILLQRGRRQNHVGASAGRGAPEVIQVSITLEPEAACSMLPAVAS
jgi:hypothetical protein